MNKNINFERRNTRGGIYFTVNYFTDNSFKPILEQRNSAFKAKIESSRGDFFV